MRLKFCPFLKRSSLFCKLDDYFKPEQQIRDVSLRLVNTCVSRSYSLRSSGAFYLPWRCIFCRAGRLLLKHLYSFSWSFGIGSLRNYQNSLIISWVCVLSATLWRFSLWSWLTDDQLQTRVLDDDDDGEGSVISAVNCLISCHLLFPMFTWSRVWVLEPSAPPQSSNFLLLVFCITWKNPVRLLFFSKTVKHHKPSARTLDETIILSNETRQSCLPSHRPRNQILPQKSVVFQSEVFKNCQKLRCSVNLSLFAFLFLPGGQLRSSLLQDRPDRGISSHPNKVMQSTRHDAQRQ